MNQYELFALIVWVIWTLLITFTMLMIIADIKLPYRLGSAGPLYTWSIATVLIVAYFAFT